MVIEEEDIDLLDLALERISDHDVRMQMIESMADETSNRWLSISR